MKFFSLKQGQDLEIGEPGGHPQKEFQEAPPRKKKNKTKQKQKTKKYSYLNFKGLPNFVWTRPATEKPTLGLG